MAVNVGRLGVVLGIDTTELITGLSGASLAILKFVDKAKPAILGVAAAMVGLTARAIQYANEVEDLASANDLAIGSIINLGLGLDNSGGRAENAGKLIGSFTSKVDAAAEGSKGAQRAFDRIGISLSDIGSKTNQQLLEQTIAKLAAINDPVTRNALSFEVFGRAIRGVDIKNLNKELQDNKEVSEAQAEGIAKAAEVADKLNRFMKDLYITIGSELGPKLLDTIDYFNTLSTSGNTVGEVFRTVFETIVILGANVYFVLERIVSQIGAIFSAAGSAIKGDFREAYKILSQYDIESAKLRKNLEAFEAKILNRTPSAATKKTGGTGGTDRPVSDAETEAIRKAQYISEAYINQNNLLLLQIDRKGELLNLSQKEREVANALNSLEDDRLKKIQDIEKQINAETSKSGSTRNQGLINALGMEIDKINQLAGGYATLTESKIRAQQAAADTFEGGFGRAFNRFAEDATSAAKIGERAFESFASAAESALDSFVRTGKVAFGDLIREALIGLVKLEIKLQTIAFLKSASGAGGAGGIISTIGSFLGFAAGGNPTPGVPYVVGENGPELKIDRSPSTIIPLNNSGSGADESSSGITVNGPYIASFSAIDAQSGAQFLMNQYQTIWAANQKASQGKPSGGRYF